MKTTEEDLNAESSVSISKKEREEFIFWSLFCAMPKGKMSETKNKLHGEIRSLQQILPPAMLQPLLPAPWLHITSPLQTISTQKLSSLCRHRKCRFGKGKANKSRVEIMSLGSVYSASASPDRQSCTALDNWTKSILAAPLEAKYKI